MQYVVDRFEGNLAVLVSKQDSSVKNVERGLLPEGVEAGWTVFEEGGCWLADLDDTLSRKERIRAKMAEVFKH